jgi:hypothetical protein
MSGNIPSPQPAARFGKEFIGFIAVTLRLPKRGMEEFLLGHCV